MRSDLTDLTVVLDRSGSMESFRTDAEGGLNRLVEEQKKHPGEAVFTLVQFDTEYEFIHKGVPIKDVPPFTLVPRGWTALLDAVGRAIVETGERIGKLEEKDRPGLVVFVIVTDGQENRSKEFTLAQIKEKIKHQEETYKWQFTFLGANSDAFSDAAGMGISKDRAANYTMKTAGMAFMAASNNVGRMRTMARGGQSVRNSYTPEELEAMAGKSGVK